MNKKLEKNIIISTSFIIIIILVILVINNSIRNKQTNSSEVELTPRQINILKQQNLSTNYNDLNLDQKESIDRIEEMFKYLDEKYKNYQFEYKGYITAKNIENEQLIVEYNYKTCTVTNKNKQLTDDCTNIIIKKDYEKYIEQFFNNNEISNVKIYADIAETTEKYNISKYIFDDTTESRNMIFIDGKNYTEEEANQLIEMYKNWITEHNLYGLNQIIYVKSEIFSKITEYNYSDYFVEEYCLYRKDVDLFR